MIGILFWLLVAGVAYTYAGYPLLLAGLARLRPKPGPFLPATPHVTLLISALNEQAILAQKIENSLALDYPRDRLQIVVAADGSSDQTADIVRSYAARGVELSYSPPRQGKMAAINRAMPLARGEIVVFSDANNMYEPMALRELVLPFSAAGVGAVTGAKVIVGGDGALGDSEGLYWKYESFIKKQESRLSSCTGAAGEILAIRRHLFEPPPAQIINDDFYIALRVVRRGFRVMYAPEARSAERVSLSAHDEMARRARIVAGRYQAIALGHRLLPFRQPLVVWQAVSHKFLRPLVPLAMAGALLLNLLAMIFPPAEGGLALLFLAPPYNVLMLAGQGLFYGSAWIGNRLQRRGALGKALYLPTFLVNSNWAALSGLYRFLTRRQTVLWQRARRAEH